MRGEDLCDQVELVEEVALSSLGGSAHLYKERGYQVVELPS